MELLNLIPEWLAHGLSLGLALVLGGVCAHAVNALPRHIYAQYAPQDVHTLPAPSRVGSALLVLGSGVIWGLSAWHWGMTLTAVCWSGFFMALLTLTAIDVRTLLLPDLITQPLLWVGLLASNTAVVSLPLSDAVLGAAAGYSALWAVAAVFERVTGQEGMGAGDFKLLAALGAWLGPWALLPLALIASSLCVVAALAMSAWGRSPEDGHLPFGPCLALGGAVMAIFGADITLFLLG